VNAWEEDMISKWGQLSLLWAMGTEMTFCVVGGLLGGYYLDRPQVFNTSPWLTVIFLTAGFVTGVLNVFRLARKFQKL